MLKESDPPVLEVGTEVSAKYKGAFCEAKIRKINRNVKVMVSLKTGGPSQQVAEENIRGALAVGSDVSVKLPDKRDWVEGSISKIKDCSQYTVVFDDGDINCLRRSALCLKSGRHFAEGETLDQLPLTHPEHFGNPVNAGGRRRRRQIESDSESSEEEEEDDDGGDDDGESCRQTPTYGKKMPQVGEVICILLGEKKRQKDNWIPGLVVAPTAQDTCKIKVSTECLVRSFQDGRYYTVPKKEMQPFSREVGEKADTNTLKAAVEKAFLYLDKDELPPHWDRDVLFGKDMVSDRDSSDEDASDEETREQKDHFVAQLYKFLDESGRPINKAPMIGNVDLDLYRLYKIVKDLGGFNRVDNNSQWRAVYEKMGLPSSLGNYGINQLKAAYKRHLQTFEEFNRKLGCTLASPRGNRNRHSSSTRSLIRVTEKARLTLPGLMKKAPNRVETRGRKPKSKPSTPNDSAPPTPTPSTSSVPSWADESPAGKADKDGKGGGGGVDDDDGKSVMSEPAVKRRGRRRGVGRGKASLSPSPSPAPSVSSVKDEKRATMDEARPPSASPSPYLRKQSLQSVSSVTEVKSFRRRDPISDESDAEFADELPPKVKRGLLLLRRRSDSSAEVRGSGSGGDGKDKVETDDEKEGEKGEEEDSNADVKVGHRVRVLFCMGKDPSELKERPTDYEAKVLRERTSSKTGEKEYYVHYRGWNVRWDEWVARWRIVSNLTAPFPNQSAVASTPRGSRGRRKLDEADDPRSSAKDSPSEETRGRKPKFLASLQKKDKDDDGGGGGPGGPVRSRSGTPSSVVSSSSCTSSLQTGPVQQTPSFRVLRAPSPPVPGLVAKAVAAAAECLDKTLPSSDGPDKSPDVSAKRTRPKDLKRPAESPAGSPKKRPRLQKTPEKAAEAAASKELPNPPRLRGKHEDSGSCEGTPVKKRKVEKEKAAIERRKQPSITTETVRIEIVDFTKTETVTTVIQDKTKTNASLAARSVEPPTLVLPPKREPEKKDKGERKGKGEKKEKSEKKEKKDKAEKKVKAKSKETKEEEKKLKKAEKEKRTKEEKEKKAKEDKEKKVNEEKEKRAKEEGRKADEEKERTAKEEKEKKAIEEKKMMEEREKTLVHEETLRKLHEEREKEMRARQEREKKRQNEEVQKRAKDDKEKKAKAHKEEKEKKAKEHTKTREERRSRKDSMSTTLKKDKESKAAQRSEMKTPERPVVNESTVKLRRTPQAATQKAPESPVVSKKQPKKRKLEEDAAELTDDTKKVAKEQKSQKREKHRHHSHHHHHDKQHKKEDKEKQRDKHAMKEKGGRSEGKRSSDGEKLDVYEFEEADEPVMKFNATQRRFGATPVKPTAAPVSTSPDASSTVSPNSEPSAVPGATNPLMLLEAPLTALSPPVVVAMETTSPSPVGAERSPVVSIKQHNTPPPAVAQAPMVAMDLSKPATMETPGRVKCETMILQVSDARAPEADVKRPLPSPTVKQESLLSIRETVAAPSVPPPMTSPRRPIPVMPPIHHPPPSMAHPPPHLLQPVTSVHGPITVPPPPLPMSRPPPRGFFVPFYGDGLLPTPVPSIGCADSAFFPVVRPVPGVPPPGMGSPSGLPSTSHLGVHVPPPPLPMFVPSPTAHPSTIDVGRLHRFDLPPPMSHPPHPSTFMLNPFSVPPPPLPMQSMLQRRLPPLPSPPLVPPPPTAPHSPYSSSFDPLSPDTDDMFPPVSPRSPPPPPVSSSVVIPPTTCSPSSWPSPRPGTVRAEPVERVVNVKQEAKARTTWTPEPPKMAPVSGATAHPSTFLIEPKLLLVPTPKREVITPPTPSPPSHATSADSGQSEPDEGRQSRRGPSPTVAPRTRQSSATPRSEPAAAPGTGSLDKPKSGWAQHSSETDKTVPPPPFPIADEPTRRSPKLRAGPSFRATPVPKGSAELAAAAAGRKRRSDPVADETPVAPAKPSPQAEESISPVKTERSVDTGEQPRRRERRGTPAEPSPATVPQSPGGSKSKQFLCLETIPNSPEGSPKAEESIETKEEAESPHEPASTVAETTVKVTVVEEITVEKVEIADAVVVVEEEEVSIKIENVTKAEVVPVAVEPEEKGQSGEDVQGGLASCSESESGTETPIPSNAESPRSVASDASANVFVAPLPPVPVSTSVSTPTPSSSTSSPAGKSSATTTTVVVSSVVAAVRRRGRKRRSHLIGGEGRHRRSSGKKTDQDSSFSVDDTFDDCDMSIEKVLKGHEDLLQPADLEWDDEKLEEEWTRRLTVARAIFKSLKSEVAAIDKKRRKFLKQKEEQAAREAQEKTSKST